MTTEPCILQLLSGYVFFSIDGYGVLKSVCTRLFQTIRCTLEDTDLMSSDPIKLNVTEGQTVEIYSACQQNKPEGLKCLCYQRSVLGG